MGRVSSAHYGCIFSGVKHRANQLYWTAMIFDDLSLRAQILLGLIAPPILTLICWFGGRRLARLQHQPQSKTGF